MEITPELPDGYEGKVRKLVCKACQQPFYIAQSDLERLNHRYCHLCSKKHYDEEYKKQVKEQGRALVAEARKLVEQVDTPDQAVIRRFVERRFKGYTMNLCIKEKNGWAVSLNKRVYRDVYEAIFCFVHDEMKGGVRHLMLLPMRPPTRYRVESEELTQLQKKRDEIRKQNSL